VDHTAGIADVEGLLAGIARRLRCAEHPKTIGEARRPGFSGRYLKQVVSDPQQFLAECWDRKVMHS
jgi:hypothetical protein